MVSITVYGLDQFVVGDISRDFTTQIAKIYEIDEDDVNFIAPQAMVFHKGMDQSSWNVIIHVHAPLKLKPLQNNALQVILNAFMGPTIHVDVQFYYFSEEARFLSLNEEYPRFINEDNTVDTAQEYNPDIEEGDGDDEIFTGDIFERLKN